MSAGSTPLLASTACTVSCTARHQSWGSCSAQPFFGWDRGYSAVWLASTRPFSSNRTVLVPDVPRSMPMSAIRSASPPVSPAYAVCFFPSGKMILFTKKKMTMEIPPFSTVVPML